LRWSLHERSSTAEGIVASPRLFPQTWPSRVCRASWNWRHKIRIAAAAACRGRPVPRTSLFRHINGLRGYLPALCEEVEVFRSVNIIAA